MRFWRFYFSYYRAWRIPPVRATNALLCSERAIMQSQNWHVFSWPKAQVSGQIKDHGNYDFQQAVELRQHLETLNPARDCEVERCYHPEHQTFRL